MADTTTPKIPDVNHESTKQRMTMLNMPLEMRRLIYQYFLKIDTDFDVPDDTVPARLDLTLLHVSCQMRREALEYLLDNNLWSRVTVESNQINVIREVGSIPHIPLGLLPLHERQCISAKAVLHLYIGDLLETNSYITNVLHNDVLVCNIAGSQISVPKLLLKPNLRGQPAVIALHKGLSQYMIEPLILPFTRLRGRAVVSWVNVLGIEGVELANAFMTAVNGSNFRFQDYQEQMTAFKEGGDRFLTFGHFRAAAACYLDGLRVAESFLAPDAVFERRPNLSQTTMIQSISCDLANNFGLVSNKIVALSRGSDGVLSLKSIHLIAKQFDMYQIAFALYYLTDQQRSEAHHRYSIALETLGEYLSISEYRDYMIFHLPPVYLQQMDRQPNDLLREATANSFYAWHANTESALAGMLLHRFNEMSSKYGFYMLRDPHLATVTDLRWRKDWTWVGDPRLVEDWTEINMMRGTRLVEVRTEARTTAEVMSQVRRDLGLLGSGNEGLIRLLRIGAIEYAEITGDGSPGEYAMEDEDDN